MSKFLEAKLSEAKLKKLLLNLFKNHTHYNWRDPQFQQLVHAKLFTLLGNLSEIELKDFLAHYLRIARQQYHSINTIIKFLDDLYAA